MKTSNKAFTLFLFLIFSVSAYSQSQWVTQNSNTFENLNCASFTSVNLGYASGNNGKVIKTTNQGSTWYSLPFPVYGDNLSIYFTSTNTGYVGTNYFNNIYKTTNGGYNWVVQTNPANNPVISIRFTNASTGWAGVSGGNNILKTTNAGANWNIVGFTPGTNSYVFFLNNDRGWIADNQGYVSYTTNSGNNFTSVKVSTNPLNSVFFATSSTGYAAGDSGKVFRTSDGGLSWLILNTGTAVNLKSITGNIVNSVLRLWAVGVNGNIIESYNWGDTWFQQNVGTSDLNFVVFPSTTIGFAVGNTGKIIFTNLTVNLLPACIGSETFQAGYPFTTYWMDGRTDMLYTAAEIIQSGGQAGYVTKIGFNVQSYSPQIMNGFKVKMQNTTISALLGFQNDLWTIVYEGNYAVLGTGLQNITLQNPIYWDGVNNLLVEICFNNSAYTNYSNVNASSAPNMTWTQYTDLPSGDGCSDLNAGSVRNFRPNICFTFQTISGEKTINVGVPDKFSLYQNYPNPFNPETKIKFDISSNPLLRGVGEARGVFTSLKVFDITGREIQTLVNEKLNAGTYEVTFDGSNLPSGVYFYQLRAGDFINTKKLILLK